MRAGELTLPPPTAGGIRWPSWSSAGELTLVVRKRKTKKADQLSYLTQAQIQGSEMAHTQIGLELLRKFAEACKEVSNVEKEPKLEGRQMIMFLAPLKKKP